MNNSGYFIHSASASRNSKIERLEFDLGLKGYATYFKILEKLCENDGVLVKDYKLLSKSLHISAKLLQKVVENYDLFCQNFDKNIFYSEKILNFLNERSEVSNTKKSAAYKRWGEKKSDAYAYAEKENQNSKNVSRAYAEKEKEKKKEKESTPLNPLKEKEINKEKEKFDDGVDTHVHVHACEKAEKVFEFEKNETLSQTPLNTQTQEKEKSCDKKEKEPIYSIKPSFEDETFNAPLPTENQKNANHWQGNWQERFEQNLKEILQQPQLQAYTRQRFSSFSKQEKKDCLQEFVLRNATDRKYTAIYYDRDLQNEMRKHLLNFLNSKLTIKQNSTTQIREPTFMQRVAEKLKTQGAI